MFQAPAAVRIVGQVALVGSCQLLGFRKCAAPSAMIVHMLAGELLRGSFCVMMVLYDALLVVRAA
jgi:hypothetical protein